jgi:cell division protein FtsW
MHFSSIQHEKTVEPGNLPLNKKGFSAFCEKGTRVDRLLLCLIVTLSILGSVMIFSASYANAAVRYGDSLYYIKRQILWLVIGFMAMLLFSRFSPSFYKAYTPLVFAVTVVLLLAVLLVGESGGGAKRWIAIGSLTFQPSELAKTALVLMLSRHFARHRSAVMTVSNKGRNFLVGTLVPLGYIGLICGLVALEKHLSCIIILGMLGVVMMFVGGSRGRYLAIFGAAGTAAVAALALFTDYTKRRILIWQNPAAYPLDGGWQTLQGMMAIGSGGFFGLGLGNSRLKFSYVSEPQNDFIFTITCEELGFLGAFIILALFAAFVYRGYTVALRHPHPFCGLVAFGICTKIALQVLLNVAVVTNSIPNTGISLPFFSYGGSSLVMLFAEMGILLSISRSSHIPI